MLFAVALATVSTSFVSCSSDEPVASNPAHSVISPDVDTESIAVTASLPAGIKSRTAEGQFLGDGKEISHFVWALYDAESGEVVDSGEENCTLGQGSFSFKFQAVSGVRYKLFACADSKKYNINLVSHEIVRARGSLYDTKSDNADFFMYFSDEFTSSNLDGTMTTSLTRPFVQVVLVSKSVDAIPEDVKAKQLSTSLSHNDTGGQAVGYNFWKGTAGFGEPNKDYADWPVELALDKADALPVKGFEDYQLISYGNFFTNRNPSSNGFPFEAGLRWTVKGRDGNTYYKGGVTIPKEMVKQNTRIVISDANGGIFTDKVDGEATVSTDFNDESAL